MTDHSPFCWLTNWLRHRPPLTHLRFVLYTRQGCHLCDLAHEQLLRSQARNGFALTVMDVDTDPELVRLYSEKVPVVAVNDKVRFWGRVNPVLLARLLEGERLRTEPRPSPKTNI